MKVKLLSIVVSLFLLSVSIKAEEIGKVYLTDDGRECRIESKQMIDDFEGDLTKWKTSVVGKKEPKGIISLSLNKDKQYCKENQSLKITFQKNKSSYGWVRYYGLAPGDGVKYNALGFYLYVPDKNLKDFRVHLYYAPEGNTAGIYKLKNLSPGTHYIIIPKESFSGMTDEKWGKLSMLFFFINGKDIITAYVDNLSFLNIKKLGKGIVIDNFENEDINIFWGCSSMVWRNGRGQKAEKKFAEISLNEDKRYVKGGKRSLKVSCAAESNRGYVLLRKTNIPRPSSETDAITFWIYNQEGGGRFYLILFNSVTWNHFDAGYFPIDFVGWKKFVIPKEKMRAKRDIKWTDVNYLQFALHGDFVIYIDDIKFESSKTAKEIIENPEEKPKGVDITPE